MQTVWRELTDEEIQRWPEARLGGALLWITVLTGLISALLAIMLMVALYTISSEGADAFFGAIGATQEGPYGFVPLLAAGGMLTLLAWGALVFCLTLARARSGPAIIALGAAIVLAVDIGTSAATQWLIASASDGGAAAFLATLLPLVPRWLAEAVTIAATIGYFLGAVRPNAYFRRRVAVPLHKS